MKTNIADNVANNVGNLPLFPHTTSKDTWTGAPDPGLRPEGGALKAGGDETAPPRESIELRTLVIVD